MNSTRDEILEKLKAAGKKVVPPRPELPALNELSLDREALVDKFSQEIAAQSGVVHRVKNKRNALAVLTAIVQSEEISTVMASNDDVVKAMNLPVWAKEDGIKVLNVCDFNDRDRFIDVVFDEAQAGITGADFAVAESGTIGLIHNRNQPRLISLAPLLHIAIVPLDRLVPVYEGVTKIVFDHSKGPPNHLTFISGPSMTGDIQATLFKGMHGPKNLEVILIG